MTACCSPAPARARARCSPAAARRPSRAGAGSGQTEPFTVMLDYFPNADHAGIYAAQASGEYERAGLDVKIQCAAGRRRAAQAAAGRPRRPRDLLRARAAAGARQGRRDLVARRRARADAADLADVARRPRDHDAGAARRQARRHRRASRTSRPTCRRSSRRPASTPDSVEGDQRRLQPRAGDALQEGRRHARRVLELRGRRPRAPRPQAG